MRLVASQLIPALLFFPVGMACAGAAEADLPDRERIHQSYELTPGATVEVSGIAGPVTVETANDDTADVTAMRSAPTHADLACGRIAIEQTAARLTIRSESLCSVVRGQQRVMLKLPRWVDLSLENIAGDVRIGPADGRVRLESIAGHVEVALIKAAKMSSLAGGLKMTVGGVGDRGIRVSSVTGGIDLGVRKGVDADVRVSSVVGHVHSESSDIRISRDDDSDYLGVVGSGGNTIVIASVVGPVAIRRAE